MCSNYHPISKSRAPWVKEHFNLELPGVEYKSHIFHGGFGPFIFMMDGRVHCELGQFGLEPHWAEFRKNYHSYGYNAKSETVDSLQTFRHAWSEKHFGLCLAESFIEPYYSSKDAKPVWTRIKRSDGQPVAIGCIWERYTQKQSGQIKNSFSMITQDCEKHPLLVKFHKPEKEKRTIVVLDNEEMHEWLNASHEKARELVKLPDVSFLQAEGF